MLRKLAFWRAAQALPEPQRFIYGGSLTDDEVDHIRTMLRHYAYPVEVAKMPGDFYDWSRTALIDYDDVAENCMGVSYSRKTKMYGVLHRQGGAGNEAFIFFKSPGERSAFIAAFPGAVIDPEPFKTIIE